MSEITRMKKSQPENVKDFLWCSKIQKLIYVRKNENEKISTRKCERFPLMFKNPKINPCQK